MPTPSYVVNPLGGTVSIPKFCDSVDGGKFCADYKCGLKEYTVEMNDGSANPIISTVVVDPLNFDEVIRINIQTDD